jgi:non-ribosomal peptide synthetase component F
MIEHESVNNYIFWCQEAYCSEGGKDSLIHSSLAFDMPVTSLFSPLLSGSKIYILSLEEGTKELYSILSSELNFDFIKLTPSHLKMLKEK